MPTLPRVIPLFDTVRIADQPLPTNFVHDLRTDWNNLYDLRDYLLNLFVDDENVALSAPMNGTNKNFTLQAAPQPPQSLELFRNGRLLINGTDYTLLGNSLTLAVAPVAVDSLVAYYRERGTPSTISGAGSVSTGAGGGGGGGGGGGSTGGLWTLTGNFLYPTTLSNIVLAGVASSDAFITAGAMASTGPLGIMTAATNASTLFFIFSGGLAVIASGRSGTGTFLPMTFATNNIERCRITTTGIFLVGFTSTDYFGGPAQIVTQTLGCISAATNASVFSVNVGAAIFFTSQFSGSGTRVPMAWNMATEVMRLTVGGTLLVGLTSSDVFTGFGQIAASSAIGVATSPTNATAFYIQANLGSSIFLNSTHTGTGTALPVVWGINNAEVMRLTTGGTLLVGLTTSDLFGGTSIAALAPSGLMGLATATVNASAIYFSSGSGAMYLQANASGTGTQPALGFATTGIERARFTVAGTFLVGFASSDVFTSPSQIAAGAIGVISAATNASTLYLSTNPGVEVQIISTASGTGTLLPLAFYTGGARRMILTTGGQFFFARSTSAGVGATMQITGNFEASGLNNAFGFNGTTANVTANAILAYQSIQIQSTGSTTASFLSFQCDNSSNLSQITSGQFGGGTLLPLTVNVGGAERMRLTTAGGLFVGLSSSDFFGPSTIGVVVMGPGGLGIVSATTNATAFQMSITGTGIQFVSTASGTGSLLPFYWNMGGTEKMRFTQAGLLLVGATSSDVFSGPSQVAAIGSNNVLGVSTAATNGSHCYLGIRSSLVVINSGHGGTGTTLPITFTIDGTLEAMRITTGGVLQQHAFTVATLPSPVQGGRSFVTDATSITFAAAAVGGGTNIITVWSNGSSWFIG
jgi:hypothetical protein